MKYWIVYIILVSLFSSCNAKKDPVSTVTYLTKAIAHRGAWKTAGAPENSIESLQQAMRLGCYGSEFDAQMSTDSGLFVYHDSVFQGFPIETTSTAQLSKLKLSNGETLPTLQAYLTEGIKQSKTHLIMEIKGSRISQARSFAAARKIVELVKSLKAEALVEYSSFDYDVCKKILELNPTAKVAYLNGDQPPEQLATDKLSGLEYYFSIFVLKENWIREAQEKKLTVNVWTVNDQISMKWFLERKVDFITTDEPETLLELLK
jgi:glycerophosphoryl diester phosphodiesterase